MFRVSKIKVQMRRQKLGEQEVARHVFFDVWCGLAVLRAAGKEGMAFQRLWTD